MRPLNSCHQRRRGKGSEAAVVPVLPDARVYDCCCSTWHRLATRTHLIFRERRYPESPHCHLKRHHLPRSVSASLVRPRELSLGRITQMFGGDDDKQLKNRHDPLTEIHISCAGSGCSCCHRGCRKQRRVSSDIFFSDQRAFGAAEPTLLRAALTGSPRLLPPLAPAGRPPSSLFNQSHALLPSHISPRCDFAATEMAKGIFPGFSRE